MDLNRANNLESNLIVMSSASHAALHVWLRQGAPIGPVRRSITDDKVVDILNGKLFSSFKAFRCSHCGSIKSSKHHKFCSPECYSDSTRRDFPASVFKAFFKRNLSWVAIGKELGLSDNGARRAAKVAGFDLKSKTLKNVKC